MMFAPLLLAAEELEALRDLIARRLVEVGQPITEPVAPDNVGLLWSLHTALAEARYSVDPPVPSDAPGPRVAARPAEPTPGTPACVEGLLPDECDHSASDGRCDVCGVAR